MELSDNKIVSDGAGGSSCIQWQYHFVGLGNLIGEYKLAERRQLLRIVNRRYNTGCICRSYGSIHNGGDSIDRTDSDCQSVVVLDYKSDGIGMDWYSGILCGGCI